MIKSAIGTEFAISTNQLDFLATETFGLSYIGGDGAEHPVYVIHRAPLGSHERFVAFLIEHFAGAFPVWLSPIQIRVVPITDRQNEYALALRDKIFAVPVMNGTSGLRVDVNLSNERMQKKIRTPQTEKIPYMLVVGNREAEDGTVAVRLRSGKDLGAMPLEAFLAHAKHEAESRRDRAD
jgi:threonyl-tRNA synthetase